MLEEIKKLHFSLFVCLFLALFRCFYCFVVFVAIALSKIEEYIIKGKRTVFLSIRIRICSAQNENLPRRMRIFLWVLVTFLNKG